MPQQTDVHAMASALRQHLQGDVRTDILSRQLYSTDASDYHMVPSGVILPRNTADIAAAIKIAAQYQAAVIPRGGGSSLSGQTVGEGWVIDHSKHLNRILEINVTEQWAWVEAGVVLDCLNAELASHGLMVGPDPSSSAVATIGGMAGNNSTGAHSFKYGMLSDHIQALEVVLSDGSTAILEPKDSTAVRQLALQNSLEGRLYDRIPQLLDTYHQDILSGYPGTWRNVAGYGLNRLVKNQMEGRPFNLAPLVVGSEGTLAYTTRIKIGLVERPKSVRLMILPFADLAGALGKVPFILEQDVAAVELMTHTTLKLADDHVVAGPLLRQFLEGIPGAILIVEFAGTGRDDVDQQAHTLEQRLHHDGYSESMTHGTTTEEIQRIWTIRKSVLGLLLSTPGPTKRTSIIDDATVPVEELVSFTREVTEAGQKYNIPINFDGHASAGCLHTCPAMNYRNPEDLRKLEWLAKDIMEIAIRHHGSTTGEHGEGLARSYYNEQLYGPRLHEAFRKVKDIFDPDNRLNPGKVLNPSDPWDPSRLRYSPDYRTPLAPSAPYFDYSYFGGFAGLVEMCNGQGICRNQVSGVMCPSYQVTLEENHSPRGRANALRSAITGQLGADGLKDKRVFEILDLCLECKACKVECTTGVDVAKLKYEFLAHYQAEHGIPLRSRLFGEMERINQIGRRFPRLSNALLTHPLTRRLLDRSIGIDRRRPLPRYSPIAFEKWFDERSETGNAHQADVILWDDCYIRDYQPELGIAAVRVLEAAGLRVIRIDNHRCCGRPLISKGLLKKARDNARWNIDRLAGYADREIPIVGVEPSCITCFRDEYPDLVRTDAARNVARHAFFFEEFLTDLADRKQLELKFAAPRKPRSILLHTHCYQKSFGTAEKVVKMLELLPDTHVTEIDSGCCGMAGAFGYEKEHYDISMAIGEQRLFPSVRQAAPETIIAAAGTSCREQIKQGTRRSAVHPISILADALSTPECSQ
jgi:FAD/FMN-containing dehydrogenase/Fe-S oxidoreductase